MAKRKFRKLKIVSLILSVIMLAYAMPFQAVAAKDDVAPAKEPGITVSESETSDPTLDWKGDPITSKSSVFGIESFEERNSRSTDGFAEGIYSFRNIEHSDMWFDTRGDSHNADTYIQQYKYTTNPAATNYFERSGLFKITIHPDEGTYIIRSMRNNRYTLGLYESGGCKYIQTQEIPLNDADVERADTFEIEYDSNMGGYTVKQYGTNNYITSRSATASGYAGGMASCLQFTSKSDTSAWTVTKYTGSLKKGTVFEHPDSWDDIGLIQDVYENTRLVGWCTQPNYNTPYILPIIGYDDMSDCLWNPDSARFTLTPRFPGEIKFNIGMSISNEHFATTSNFYLDKTYSSRIVPQEGAYYIQNAGTEKYIYLSGSIATTMSNPLQYQYDEDIFFMRWEIEHVPGSGGYVRIKPVGEELYLGITSPNPYEYDVILTEEQDDLSLWSIDVTQRKTLVFSCYDVKHNDLVIFAPNSTNGAAIQQTTYVDDTTNLKDEWHLVKRVISVVNYYDNSFNSYNNGALIEYIDDAVSFANIVYARYLNIGIYMDGSATKDEYAIADQCPRGRIMSCNSSVENNPCPSTCKLGHHKNNETMSNYLFDKDRESDHIYVMWAYRSSGYCKSINGVHTNDSDAIGEVLYKRPVINMKNIIGNGYTEKLACMSIGLAHEITHCLNMSDVYDNGIHSDSINHEAYVCIMAPQHTSQMYQFYHNIREGTFVDPSTLTNRSTEVVIGTEPFCPSCLATMKQKVNAYVTDAWPINGNITQSTSQE